MAQQRFSDGARGYLAQGAAAQDTRLLVQGERFPAARGGDWFKLVLQDAQDADAFEIAYVRGHEPGSGRFEQVLRGQEGTAARDWPAGTVAGLRLTAGDVQALHQAVDGLTLAGVFYPYVIEGFLPETPEAGFTGLALEVPAGVAWVEGRRVAFAGAPLQFEPGRYTDVYVGADGQLLVDSAASYADLVERETHAKLFRVATDATRILGVNDFRNRARTLRPVALEGALHFDKLLDDFEIPVARRQWAAATAFDAGEVVRRGPALYRALAGGVSGDEASAPSGRTGVWDDTLKARVFRDGQCVWRYEADAHLQGAFRWGVNNGVVWYFSTVGLYYIMDRLPAERVRQYLDCHIFNLVLRWTSGADVQVGMKRYWGGQVYEAVQAGRTGVTPPSGRGAQIADGTAVWAWVTHHVGEYPEWQAGQTVAAGERRVSNGLIYQALDSGACGQQAPAHRLGAVSDGALRWEYLAEVGLFAQGADYYMLDLMADMVTPRPADSHDAYASSLLRLAAAWLHMQADDAWLTQVNAHGQTNLDTLKGMAFANLARCQRSYAVWQAGQSVAAGERRWVNGGQTGRVLQCVQGGVTGASMPVPGAPGSLVDDGPVRWPCVPARCAWRCGAQAANCNWWRTGPAARPPYWGRAHENQCRGKQCDSGQQGGDAGLWRGGWGHDGVWPVDFGAVGPGGHCRGGDGLVAGPILELAARPPRAGRGR